MQIFKVLILVSIFGFILMTFKSFDHLGLEVAMKEKAKGKIRKNILYQF